MMMMIIIIMGISQAKESAQCIIVSLCPPPDDVFPANARETSFVKHEIFLRQDIQTCYKWNVFILSNVMIPLYFQHSGPFLLPLPFYFPHVYVPHAIRPSWFNYLNSVRRRVLIVCALVMQFFSFMLLLRVPIQ
jgi:hypothetical protein